MLDELQWFRIYKEANPNDISMQQILDLEKEIKFRDSRLMSDEYVDFKLWINKHPSRQETFANFIGKKFAKMPGMKILEIGCGRTGRVSRILGEKGFRITGIDPKVEMLSCGNTNFIKERFDYKKFDLSEYDFVIAQEPCEATEHVVRACLLQRVPFIMSLCGVPHRLISGRMPKSETEWYEYLVNISKEEIRLSYLSLDPITITPLLRSNF